MEFLSFAEKKQVFYINILQILETMYGILKRYAKDAKFPNLFTLNIFKHYKLYKNMRATISLQ